MLIYSEHQKNSIDISLDFCGFEDCPPNYKYGPDIRDLYVLHYISKGSGTYYFDDKTIHLERGDLFLLFPDEITTYQSDNSDPWSYYWLGISGRKAKEYFSYSKIHTTKFIQDKTDKSKQIGDLMALAVEYTNKDMGNQIQNETFYLSTVYNVLYKLSHNFPIDQTSLFTNQTQSICQLAKRNIDKRYKDNLTIQNLANDLNVSRSYLSKNFQKYYHTSPKAYLMEVRMERAKQLLKITDEPINIIGKSVGYPDSLGFSRAFKKYFGIAPSKYRKNIDSDKTIFKFNE